MNKLIIILLILFIPKMCFGALSSAIVWECRQGATANNANGGGFKTGAAGTDYSQQNAAQYALTTATTAAANAIILDASAAADMVGNIAHVISGTNFTPGWYEIISVSVGASITVDRNCTTAAGALGVINIGGAMSLNSTLDDDFFEVMKGGNTCWILNEGSNFVLGEAVTIATTTATDLAPIKIEGYDVTRGDNPTGTNRPTISGGATAFNTNVGSYRISNIIFTGTGTDVLIFGIGCQAQNIKVSNTSGTASRDALQDDGSGTIVESEFVSTIGQAVNFSGGSEFISFSYIHDSTTGIIFGNHTTTVLNCIIDTCTTGINTNAKYRIRMIGNTIYNCTTGISGTNTSGNIVINTILDNNTTGMSWTTAVPIDIIDYNCWDNTTDTSNVTKGDHDITGDPGLTAPATGDFTLGSGSNCLDAGMQQGTITGVTGDYEINIGVDQDDVTAASSAVTHSYGFIN